MEESKFVHCFPSINVEDARKKNVDYYQSILYCIINYLFFFNYE